MRAPPLEQDGTKSAGQVLEGQAGLLFRQFGRGAVTTLLCQLRFLWQTRGSAARREPWPLSSHAGASVFDP